MTHLRTRHPRQLLLVAMAAVGLGLIASSSSALAANSSSGQLVVSFTGGTFALAGGGTTPFGFWIWCQSTTSNAYGNDCAGSGYFYALNPATEPIEGSVSGSAASGYTLSVHNAGGAFAIDCTLSTIPPATPAGSNTVNVTCSAPAGSATVKNAVVTGSGT
jgi:hypothetical protein